MEHHDVEFSSPVWITWRQPFSLKEALQTLVRMTKRESAKTYYTYRIRNIETEEIIPGELLEWT